MTYYIILGKKLLNLRRDNYMVRIRGIILCVLCVLGVAIRAIVSVFSPEEAAVTMKLINEIM